MKLRYPHFQSPKEMIKALADKRDTDYEISNHAEKEMMDDCIDLLDIRSALLNAEDVFEQDRNGDISYLVIGKDTEERMISIVIEVEEQPPEIFVITVWKVKRR